MKRMLFLLATITGLSATAQERWTVQLNSAVLLTAKAEDTAANVVKLNGLKKSSLILVYTPGKVEGERKRRLVLHDAADQEVLSRTDFKLVIPVADLKKWRLTNNRMKIYTWPDPGPNAHLVRLRRMHLCTLVLE